MHHVQWNRYSSCIMYSGQMAQKKRPFSKVSSFQGLKFHSRTAVGGREGVLDRCPHPRGVLRGSSYTVPLRQFV